MYNVLMSPLAVAVLLGGLGLFFIFVSRYIRRHFIIIGLNYNGFRFLRYSSSQLDLKNERSKIPMVSNLEEFETYSGNFVFDISDFNFTLNNFRLIASFNLVNLYINSSFFNSLSSSSSSKSRFTKLLYYLFKYLVPFFQFTISRLRIITTVGDCNEASSFVFLQLNVDHILLFGQNLELLIWNSLKLDQFLVNKSVTLTESIIETKKFRLSTNNAIDAIEIIISESLRVNINVRFLYFISSFLKSLPSPDSDESSDFVFLSPFSWPILVNIVVPEIDLKFILPETEPSIKYFEWMQFLLGSVEVTCYLPVLGLFKITSWLSQFKLITQSAHRSKLGPKHFCPIDVLLNRGPEQASGLAKELIVVKNVALSNWSEGHNNTNLPESYISSWVESILKGSPLCSIESDIQNDFFKSPEFDMPFFESMKDRNLAAKTLSLDFFMACKNNHSRTLYGIFDKIEVFVPFEYPVSNLIDHSVVLFKAGWRPLSKKTDQGYWIGDGDKFLKNDWALNFKIQKVGICVEDDAFESKISAISHFQRQIAESRCRLESELLAECPPSIASNVAVKTTLHRLAQSLSVTSDSLSPNQVVPVLELQKSLFSEYRSFLNRTHLLTNWSLTDLSVDDLKLCLSWSPKYLGSAGTLSVLLNQIENGDQMTNEAIESLSTFIGGFLDVSGKSVQVNLRNYSRPILIAPNLRLVGPAFLVEDGVKDPDVLIKFPVRVLPENSQSSFSHLPADETVCVLRSIIPLKLYHCVHFTIDGSQLVQMTVSPYWLGCLALLDRVIDRFVKSSTEDPSPPLPGWDKLRYNLRGCHSRLSIASPCIISRVLDSDPISCTEVLNLSFPRGLDVGISSNGNIILNCPEASLSVDSQHLFRIKSALETSGPLHLWDFGAKHQELQQTLSSYRNLSRSSMDMSQNSLIPVIKLSKTHLILSFKIKNVFNEEPCHHWTVHPISRSNAPHVTDWEHYDTFKSFRSKSIAMDLGGFVGSSLNDRNDTGSTDEVRFLYLREFERWISRFMLAPHSDIDVVKQGPLHQSSAIPELQQRTSFSSVFTEFHLSVDFSDLFICRLLNFSSPSESQALWSASRRSLLNMNWKRGIIDQHGREDWVYYYGELEFLNVHFCVTSSSSSESVFEGDFPVKIPGIQFNDILRAPRLFYLTLDEKCFQYDPESLEVQCQTVLKRRQALLISLSDATKRLSQTPPSEIELCNQLSITIEALQKRQKYYDYFLIKTQNTTIQRHETFLDGDVDFEFADTSHFEIYNAQLVWSLANRDIFFKFVDELFVQHKKSFSQSRNGRILMRKMSQSTTSTSQNISKPLSEASSSPRAKSFCLSPTETIDSFFDSLLERKSSASSPLAKDSPGPFFASPEPEFSTQRQSNDIRKGFDFRSPVQFREPGFISVPRVVDVTFFNPQLCFLTPLHDPSGAILVSAREAKVEFSPIFDRAQFDLDAATESDSVEAKMGTRTRISLKSSSVFSGSSSQFMDWPASFLKQCYAQDLHGLQRLTAETEVTMVYDVSNVAYSWTPNSPRLKIFGNGDTIKFNSNGLCLTTTSDNFRSFLDVIVNLLVYRDPNQEIRAEKLEALLIAANLSDRRMFAAKMKEYRLRLDALRHEILCRNELELSFLEIQNVLLLFDRTERELALIGEAMRMIQASREELNQRRSRLALNVLIDRLQWTLLVPVVNEPTFELHPACNITLLDITNRWISKEDGSMENTFEIGSATFLNQLSDPFYRNVLRPFDVHNGQDGIKLKATVDYGCLLRFFAKSRLPINGIVVLDHVEVDVSPLQLQLTFDIATQIYKFFIPESIKSSSSRKQPNQSNEAPSSLSRAGSMALRQRTRTEISELILSDKEIPIDEAIELKRQNQQNVFFVYVKVPPSQHLLSYKGSGKSSLLDIDRFILSLPEMEYQNRLWTWPEFFNQIRRDMILVLLKNAGSLFKDKLKKLGQKNLPEQADAPVQDEVYLRNLARKEKITVLDQEESLLEREKKDFLVFGKSILKLMKK